MSNYYYKDGAIHNDHHKEITINGLNNKDTMSLVKLFMADNVSDVEEETGIDDIVEKHIPQKKDEVKPICRKGGRNPESLFKGKNGKKDEEKTKMKASHFIDYLKEQGIFAITIDTSRDNEVNKAFVSFYKKWVVEDEIPSYPNGNACFRFLKEDCELNMTSGDSNYMKTYGEFIRKMILCV